MRRKFHARCRLVSLGTKVLTVEQRAKLRPADKLALTQCAFETEDRGLFEAHMADAHGKKLAAVKGDAETLVKSIRRMWKSPRLTDEGKPFEPKDLEPGATVTWRELVAVEPLGYPGHLGYDRREYVERSGQVWSGASFPKSAWVVPFEPHAGELAVCVRRSSLSDRLEHSATWTADGYRDVA